MKKRMILLAGLLCIVFVLTACAAAGAPDLGTTSELKGLTLVAENETYQQDDTSITVVWKNESGKELMYGEAYGLERLKNDAWEMVGTGEMTVITIGYVLRNGDERQQTLGLSSRYGRPEPGAYRISTTCSDANPILLPDGMRAKRLDYKVTAGFTVE